MARFATCIVLLAFFIGCGPVETTWKFLKATRHFNYGVSYYENNNFEAAVGSFERASNDFSHPTIGYNIALSHFAWLRDSVGSTGSLVNTAVSSKDAATALQAVHSALQSGDLSDEMRAKLFYIEGSIHVVAGDEAAARIAFKRSLSTQADFKPGLKSLAMLESEAEDSLARLVFAVAEVGELEPEEKLPMR